MVWPLQVSPNRRYLVDAAGRPFLINGDSPWQLVLNANNAQIDTYLSDRAAKGFNAFLVEAPGACFSTQNPKYNNVDGQAPFVSTSYTAASFQSLNEAYWQRVDHLVNQAKANGILVLMFPAYLGFGGGAGNSGDQGWDSQVNAATASNLQAYGATLARRYTQGNVIWVMGGDYNPSNVAKVWNIAAGIRSVDTAALVTFHAARRNSGFSQAGTQPGFNLNTTYTDGTEYTYCATEYARPGPIPFFHIEGWYESDGNLTASGIRRQAYATVLSGGCGHMLGINDLWGVGAYGAATSAAQALSSFLNTTAANDMTRFRNLFASYAWHKLVPKTDTSLVSSGLGSGAGRIIAALASDASFAMIWSPGVGFSINMAALGVGSVRARWYDPSRGTYTAATGSPFANVGTRTFTASGDAVLVLDAG